MHRILCFEPANRGFAPEVVGIGALPVNDHLFVPTQNNQPRAAIVRDGAMYLDFN